jgi:formylmethanofuran--tetrahydromethanopterin N-formyltransferase
VIAPFPGGVVRAGSKIGSRYKKLKASTSDGYCPTIRPLVTSKIASEIGCVYEIVVDGVDQASVESAVRAGIRAACMPGVVKITAGNYGGKLGPFHIHLHRLLSGE